MFSLLHPAEDGCDRVDGGQLASSQGELTTQYSVDVLLKGTLLKHHD